MFHAWSPCFLSLLFISFFIGSTPMITTTQAFNEGYASTQEGLSNAKVTGVTSASTNKQTNLEEETSRVSINNTQVLKQESVKNGEKTPNKPSLKGRNNIVNKYCDYVPKISSKSSSLEKEASKYEGFQKFARKLLPRHQDMDAFVAYADYRGPRRHPPRNN